MKNKKLPMNSSRVAPTLPNDPNNCKCNSSSSGDATYGAVIFCTNKIEEEKEQKISSC